MSPGGIGTSGDLVVFVISGVQRFITESRSTGDLGAGSALMSELARAALAVADSGGRTVMPVVGPAATGVPNRIVVAADHGKGRDLAVAMERAVHRTWADWHTEVFGETAERVAVPGFPVTQWVVAASGPDGYAEQWQRATAAMVARKRVRDFPAHHVTQTRVCALTGRWAAVPDGPRPTGYNLRPSEPLSAVGHVKRWYVRRHVDRFPSTWSVASAPYRNGIIAKGEDETTGLWDAVAELHQAVGELRDQHRGNERRALSRGSGELPGIARSDDEALTWLRESEGAWCVPDTWEPGGLRRDHDLAADPDEDVCRSGARRAAELREAAKTAKVEPLTPYLAVIAQDADHMGERLGRFPADGTDPVEWHRRVSGALARIGDLQRQEIEKHTHLGRVVYAGGDDLLALVPASTALAAARRVNEIFASDLELSGLLRRPSASTAVVFFHASWPLQSAIAAAQRLLEEAKERERPGLGVTVLNRGGERTRLVLPWWDRTVTPARPSITHLETLVEAITGPLSGRLAAGLESDRTALMELNEVWRERELTRRAARQGIAAGQAASAGHLLAVLCGDEPGGRHVSDAAHAVLIARFLTAQTRAPSGGPGEPVAAGVDR